MTPPNAQSRYGLFAFLLVLVGLLFASQPLAAALGLARANLLAGVLDQPPYASIPFLAASGGLLALLALVLYFKQLNSHARRRARGAVYLNFFSLSLFAALVLIAFQWGTTSAPPDILIFAAALGIAIILPLFVLLIERVALWFILRTASLTRANRPLAAKFYEWSLLWQPSDPVTIRTAGLLRLEEGEFAAGAALLERLGDVGQQTDMQIIRALEEAYRAQGRIGQALICLERMQALEPKTPGLPRRILDDLMKLGRNQDALDIVESGRMKEDGELLRLRQELNVKLGNVAQALEQIRRIADHEQPPFVQAVRLYRELMAQLPNEIDIEISFGQLLLKDAAQARRHEGAQLLEQAFARDPHRLHLSRALAAYYHEAGNTERMREHQLRLVKAGDSDSEVYLNYAQHLRDEGRVADAIAVLERMNRVIGDDWRGYNRLARLLLEQDKIEEAAKQLNFAREVAPPDEAAMLDRLERDITRRRREKEMLVQTAAGSGSAPQGTDAQLTLVADMLRMDWIDKAIMQCEALLDEDPGLQQQVTQVLEVAIKQTPNYRVCDYLCDLYLVEERYDDALRVYHRMAERSLSPAQTLADGCRKILARAPKVVAARRELALVYRDAADWPAIIQALEPALQASGAEALEAEDKALWVEAASHLGRSAEAASLGLTLADALAEEPGYMMLLANILAEEGDYPNASDVLRRARRANPKDERLATLERRITGERKMHRMGVLQQHEQKGKLTADEHTELGELYHEQGDMQKAIIQFQHAASQDDRPVVAVARLAEALCARGMLDLANETLDPIELTRELAREHPQLKQIYFTVAEHLERGRHFPDALKFYKRIFFVDAAYADIVGRIERLS